MLSGLIDRLTRYIQLKAEQIQLQVMGHVARVLSQLIAFSLVALLGFFLIFFLSFALGSFLNQLLESEHLGHLIVAGAYLLGLIILLILSRTGKIQGWIEAAILKMNDSIEEEEEENE